MIWVIEGYYGTSSSEFDSISMWRDDEVNYGFIQRDKHWEESYIFIAQYFSSDESLTDRLQSIRLDRADSIQAEPGHEFRMDYIFSM